jgi:hypothetical protein
MESHLADQARHNPVVHIKAVHWDPCLVQIAHAIISCYNPLAGKGIAKMAQFFKKLLLHETTLAIAMIGLTAVITNGLIIPQLGYYHDDWYMLWSGASRGAASLVSLFSMDRPFMGVIYSVFYRIIGENILGWHLFSLLWRVAGGAAFYWILNLVWPRQKNLFVLSAMVFVVFPGFLSEPNAATKINHLIGYGSALFSIAFTLQAAKTGRRAWKYVCIGLSILLMAFYLSIYEYMIGLEVMRISLLYWMQWQGDRDTVFAAAKKVFLAYLPYILVIVMFLIWRMFIFESTRSATDLRGLVSDYRTDFLGMALRLIFQVIKDFFSSSLFAWFVQPYHLFAKAEYEEIVAAILTASSVVLLAAGYIFAIKKSKSTDDENISPLVLVLVGGMITLAAVFPVVLSNRSLNLLDAYKSYGLHPSAGVMIIIIGIVMMMRPKFRKIALVALLGLSVATLSLNNQDWAKYWEIQRNFWWQLTWRAPGIRDDTLVMAYSPEGYAFQQDYEIWGPVNLIYRPEFLSVPHIQSEVLNQGTVMDVIEGNVTDPYVRDIFIQRDFRNLLVISQPTAASCIHVIDGKMPAYSANERLIVEEVGGFSNIDRIEAVGTPPIPPAAIFGKEPEQGWCYFYQQASLARQAGDWRRIGELYDALVTAELKPADSSEYFVFIEGLVNLGRDVDARQIADSVIKENSALKYSLCKSIASAPIYSGSYGYHQDQISKIICE